jgi:hypothetical protein
MTTSSTDEISIGSCDGTATAIVSGGSSPYSYAWDDPSSQTNSIATALCAGTFSVTITDSNCDVFTATATVGSGSVIGLDQKRNSPTLYLYPNPATTQLTIELHQNPGPFSITMRDLSGRTVFCITSSDSIKTINISSVPAGIYAIEVLSSEKIYMNKVIVN